MSTSEAATTTPTTAPGASNSNENDLRRQLREAMLSLNRREPLDPTYKKLLMNSTLTRKTPIIPRHKFYKRIGSHLRARVEGYMREIEGKDPWDRISQRQPLDETSMRAAFTLREAKEHEQLPMLEATLMQQAMDPERKRALDGIALGLQSRKEAKRPRTKTPPPNASEQAESARLKAELERQQAQARQWEETRRRREEEERRRREEDARIAIRKTESPQQSLHKIIDPVFKNLWDMEFSNLDGTNPFRIVIDRDNCASIGAPDYFEVVTIPMNLTYMQEKVRKMQYTTLQAFFADVDLMIQNALTYNVAPENPYRIAAEEMKRRHEKIVKKVWQQIRQRQEQAKS